MSDIAALIQILRSKQVPVFVRGEVEYERSVATANLLYRFARPECVVQPRDSADVRLVVKEAKSRRLSITVKNGGHSYAGFSTTDQDISLDLGRMNRVDLNMESKTVTLQGGAQWGNAYKELVNGRYNGYVVNGGRCPTVGVSGFTLGGGLGPFTRSFGMGCDTLTEATIVTADAKEVTVKRSDDPKSNEGRLFWALCGAGGGNFGVVVQLKMDIRELKDPDGYVVAGVYTWSQKGVDPNELLTTMNDFYTTDWPDELTIDSSWVCEPNKDLAIRFLVYFNGKKDDFNDLINKNIRQRTLAKQLKRRSMEEKSTRFFHETLIVQWSEETIKSFPKDPSYSLYCSFVFKNDRNRIEGITQIIRDEMAAFKDLFDGEQCLLQVTWIHAGGEASRKQRSASAFRWRDGVYHTYIWVRWQEKFLEQDMLGFFLKFRDRLRSYSMMGRAAFINFADPTLQNNDHERAYFGNNRGELQKIKKIWDKDNFFNWSQGVRLPQPKKGNTASRSRPASSVRMKNMGIDLSVAAGIVEQDGADREEGDEQLAADEDFSEDEAMMDETMLADRLASAQWENYTPPTQTSFMGGIQGLQQLGF
ncbi:hypothetical protein F5Y14DRAFT_29984 [Nemania sp. NC0429]|nr:hypothetical protein F5Y14DRAFT_29984 [Nemania sp. NC0429]